MNKIFYIIRRFIYRQFFCRRYPLRQMENFDPPQETAEIMADLELDDLEEDLGEGYGQAKRDAIDYWKRVLQEEDDPFQAMFDAETWYCLHGETGSLVVFQFDERPEPWTRPNMPAFVDDHLGTDYRVLYGPASWHEAMEYLNDIAPSPAKEDLHPSMASCPHCEREGKSSMVEVRGLERVTDAIGTVYKRYELVCMRCGLVWHARVKDG